MAQKKNNNNNERPPPGKTSFLDRSTLSLGMVAPAPWPLSETSDFNAISLRPKSVGPQLQFGSPFLAHKCKKSRQILITTLIGLACFFFGGFFGVSCGHDRDGFVASIRVRQKSSLAGGKVWQVDGVRRAIFVFFFFFGVPKIGQPSVCDKLAVISSSVWADFCGLSWVSWRR